MERIMRLSAYERAGLIAAAARNLGLGEAIVEKDLWVTYFLDYLFSRCPHKGEFEFKGGTSLSKCYGLIDRFSEDLDIVISAKAIGMDLSPLLLKGTSRNKRELFAKEANERAMGFLENELIPAMKRDCERELGAQLSFELVKEDLAFYVGYPASYGDPYLLPRLKFEMSSLSALLPSETRNVKPLLFEALPALGDGRERAVRVLSPERTFWEKAMILHQEAHRETGPMPRRYSRHYYDVVKIYRSPIGEKTLANLGLMEEVRTFTEAFYNRAWAKFDEAKPGSFRLYPNESQIDGLRKDYAEMGKMIFDKRAPSFDEILCVLAEIEGKINGGNR